MVDETQLVESIANPLTSGFGTPDPKHPDWRSTRPGARPGERLAYVRDVDGERKSYISVVEHEEGETDEDGYTWGNDGYEVIISRGDASQDYHTSQSVQETAEIVAHEMMSYR